MTLSKRHVAVWHTLATNLMVNPRSMTTFERMLRHGDAFFYKHLPALGKDLERGLTGRFSLTAPIFAKQKDSELPQFLYELFIKVFNKDGNIRAEPVGIRPLRQLLMTFYKFEMPFQPEEIEKANQNFIDRDSTVKCDGWPMGLSRVRENFISLLPNDPLDIRPHHSNGATADPVSNVYKRTVRRYIPSLMRLYGPQYFFNTLTHAKNWCNVNKTETAMPFSKVTHVPKDSRGPRTICMEQPELMFIQKGIQAKLYDHIESDSPAKGRINFTDQSINRLLAQEASIDQSYATIDLKDASDMVSYNLIRLISPPEWFEALQASRSTHALVNGVPYRLKKYAPMGSALCFPIEAMVFWSILRTVTPHVWVYGDDIIVPNDKAHDCIVALESYGLVVNRDKTLTTGFFRESCGGDYYRGEDISYAKCKSYDGLHYIPFCNLIADMYGLRLADKLLNLYEDIEGPVMRQPLAEKYNPQPYVYYTDYCAASHVFFRRRWNRNLHYYELRWLHAKPLPDKHKKRLDRQYEIVDDDKLFDWFTTVEDDSEPANCSFWKQIERNIGGYHTVGQSMIPVERSTLLQSEYTVPKYSWGTDKIS